MCMLVNVANKSVCHLTDRNCDLQCFACLSLQICMLQLSNTFEFNLGNMVAAIFLRRVDGGVYLP